MFIKGIDYNKSESLLGKFSRDKRLVIGENDEYTKSLKLGMGNGNQNESWQAISGIWDQLGILFFAEGIFHPYLREKALQFAQPIPRPGAFTEAVMNAVEHGSNFCQRGDVEVRMREGAKSFLFEVTDPGNGFDTVKLDHPRQNHETGRGNGLVQLARCPAIVTCDKLQTGFRIALLYVLQG